LILLGRQEEVSAGGKDCALLKDIVVSFVRGD
jgi:hypothetical protein